MSINIDRLKILLIEDNPEPIDSVIYKYFDLHLARTPGEVAKLLNASRRLTYAAFSTSSLYDLPPFPFDGYLADFNLSEAKTGEVEDIEEEDSASEFPSTLQSTGSIAFTKPKLKPGSTGTAPDLLARGLEAAGLLTAAIAALNAPSHPAVILPYTTHPRQMESGSYAMLTLLAGTQSLSYQSRDLESPTRDLVRLLSPSTLVCGYGEEKELGRKKLPSKLQDLAFSYRENLILWSEEGIIEIPFGEGERLKKIAVERADNIQAGVASYVKWKPADYLAVHTAYGRRHISCESLWYTQEEYGSSYENIVKWLDRIPVASFDYQVAADLAHQYLEYGLSDVAVLRNELTRLAEEWDSHGSVNDINRFKILCSLFQIDFEAATSNPYAVVIPWSRPHLLANKLKLSGDTTGSENRVAEIKKRAVYMLIAAILTFRDSKVRELTEVGQVEKSIDRIVAQTEAGMLEKDSELREQWLALCNLLSEAGLRPKKSDGCFRLDHRFAIEDLAYFLDPFPERLLRKGDVWGKSGTQAIERAGFRPQVEGLLQGTFDLPAQELKAVRSFMRDFDVPIEAWPTWLR